VTDRIQSIVPSEIETHPVPSVDRDTGKDNARVRVPGGLKNREKRIDIDRVARLGVVDRPLDADLRRLVEDDIGLAERLAVADVGVDECGVVGILSREPIKRSS
jgi:hypothetical protein